MRRVLVLVIGALAVGATVVALASASEASAPSWLPQGVTPASGNWLSGEGDTSNDRFSALRQINDSNVSSLHVVWNQQFNDPSIQLSPEGQPICCANNLLYQTYIQGVAAMAPDTGAIAWNYSGPSSPQLTQLGQRVRVDNSRTTSYSAKLNLIYAGQQDGSIVALNAKTGQPVWTTSVIGAGTYGDVTGAESAPYTQYYDPPGTDGVVLSAPNGGESPFRGHIDAYDAKTGKLLWRAWNLPDPTQVPYILSWGNPAEAAVGGAADWSVPSVDPKMGDVAYGTGNPYPETGRAPGDDLWTETIMDLNWTTGQLRWFFQTTRHDEFDYDDPHPTMILRVPINGKTYPVVAEGSKGGYFYVLNETNGSQLPDYKITNVPTYDGSGKGIAQDGFSASQPVPSGASFCMTVVDYSPGGLAKCNFPGNPLVDEYSSATVVANSSTQLTNLANNWTVVGTTQSAAPYAGTYYVYGGAGGGGNFGYPPSAYDPNTTTYYACVQNESGGHSTATGSYVAASVSASSTQGITGFLSAINLSNNTMRFQIVGQATGLGDCYSGALATAGNVVFTWWKGRSDVAATLPAQGTTQQGAGSLATPGAQLDAYNATTGALLWTWGIPFDTAISPVVTYQYKGKQYLATYHGVGIAGQPGATSSGQRDQLTVFSLS
jgi:hypothetical protein